MTAIWNQFIQTADRRQCFKNYTLSIFIFYKHLIPF